MNRKKEVRNKMVVVRMNETEFKSFTTLQKRTTEKDASTYLRKVALKLPVTVKYRNESADAFLADMLQLKKELAAIGNNFNQAVHKLHILEKIPEFRTWLMLCDGLQIICRNSSEKIICRKETILWS